jgi:nicotinamide riboside kinase
MTTIINLYGGPGSGKSTSAAYLYYLLKAGGYNVELVREYVKEWAWENRAIGKFDQLYFLGKQTRKESMLYGKVDYVITDSPVLIGVYYAQLYSPPNFANGIRDAAYSFYWLAEQEGHKHIHVMLKRTKPYNAAGRYQTEAEAKGIDAAMRQMLDDACRNPLFNGDSFVETDTEKADLEKLAKSFVSIDTTCSS